MTEACAEKVTRDDTACLLDEARRTTLAEVRQMVEAISSSRDNPDLQAGVRWTQAWVLHALDEMEAAIP